MRWLAAIATAGTVLCGAAAPAGAQLILFGAGGGPTLRTSVPARLSGELTVQFHGDNAAGCSRWGLCGYSGTVSWRPPPGGSVEIVHTGGRHPSSWVDLIPSIANAPVLPGGTTSAHVVLAAGPSTPETHCVDAATTAEATSFPVARGRVTISLGQATPLLFTTRCAGPRDADILPLLPARTLSLSGLERGRTTVSLAVSRAWSGHGLTGTLTSTLALRLGRPGRTQRVQSTFGRGPERIQIIKVTYRATLSGTVVEEVSGATNPLVCGLLGACGLTGTITLTPRAHTDHAVLSAQQLAANPVRRLRAAVGLAPGPAPGVRAFGVVQWSSGGSLGSDVTQGAEHCHDAGPLGTGAVLISMSGGHVHATYGIGTTFGGAPAATRCPGPLSATGPAATGTAPLSALTRRVVRFSLTTGSTGTDAGYRVRFVPHLTLTLTRLRTSTTVVRQPAGTPVF